MSESEGSGTIHFVTGASGAPMSPLNVTNAPKWVEHIEDKQHGYMRGHVRSAVLTLEYVANSGVNQGKVIDSVVIKSKFNAEGKFIGGGAADEPAVATE
jgi:hypothetical protein